MKPRSTIKRTLLNYFKLILRPIMAAMLVFLAGNQASSQVNIVVLNVTPGTVATNETFTVEVAVDFTSPGALNVVDVYLNFNPLDIEVVTPLTPDPSAAAIAISRLPGVSVGSLSSDSGPDSPDDDKFNNVVFDNALGHVDHARFRSTGTTTSDFSFFTVTFRAKRVPPGGTTALSFNTSGLRQTAAINGGVSVLNSVIGASVTITQPLGCDLTDALISNEVTCDGKPFNLRLQSVTGGTGPFSVTVNGTTYPNIDEGDVITSVTLPTETLWPTDTIPSAFPAANDNSPTTHEGSIEVGTRFQASANGFIKGFRFYYGGQTSVGTYAGKLYSNTGTLLVSRNFSGAIGGAGWKTINLSTPIPISAGVTYVATIYSTAGNYAANPGGLAGGGFTKAGGSLTALQNGIDGASGVYVYGSQISGAPLSNDPPFGPAPAASEFPTGATGGSNYWVDVLFTKAVSQYVFNTISDANLCSFTPSQTLNVTSPDCTTLPVSLLNLSATPQGNKVALKWATASEENNRGFDIQRSNDGVSWTTVGFVAGAGNSSFTKNYSYLDVNLEARRYYYRLKQIDIDEHYKYSAIVSATLTGKGSYFLGQNYPNPTKGETIVQFTLPKAEKVNLSLFDVSGRVVKVLVNGSKDEGTHAINFNVESLTKGIYYYRMKAGDFTDVKKLTIQ